jgi:hypothetical protein
MGHDGATTAARAAVADAELANVDANTTHCRWLPTTAQTALYTSLTHSPAVANQAKTGDTTMKRIAFASLLVVTLATGAAQAQAPLDGTGRVPNGGAIMGGGGATIAGGGNDMTITYNTTGAGGGGRYGQPGRGVTFAGNSGGNPSWVYGPAPASDPGREAWLLGGGEDNQVVDVLPHKRR